MKTLRFSEIAFAILLMMAGFASCNEVITPEEPQEEKYVEVSLACAGEILEVANSPLSKPTGSNADVYHIKVYSLQPKPGEPNYMEAVQYAVGHFTTSLDGVTIRLLEGQQYKFEVTIVINEDLMVDQYTSREFAYSNNNDPAFGVPVTKEGYYGVLETYTPVEGGSVTINTIRVSYGARFEAENLTEGSLSVKVSSSNYGGELYSVLLTQGEPVNEKIYSFSYHFGVWNSYKEGTMNYSCKKYLTISWTKADGSVIPLGNFNVTFERNVKTTVKIKAEDTAGSKGITVIKENVGIIDDDNIYYISGGTVTEVPVNSGN